MATDLDYQRKVTGRETLRLLALVVGRALGLHAPKGTPVRVSAFEREVSAIANRVTKAR